jgi:hypothetical protein
MVCGVSRMGVAAAAEEINAKAQRAAEGAKAEPEKR